MFSSKHFLKSIDGGKTYTHIDTPHGDYHDLWIDPHDDKRMVNGNDGGAIVTFDGGASWSTVLNQPTGQFYTVSTDNGFPYRVYGAQQDNTTVAIASQTSGPGIALTDWYQVGGGESSYVEPDPKDPNIVFAGSFWGILTRYDHRTGSIRNISAWPDFPGGRTAAGMKYRFQWTYPIAVVPDTPEIIYIGSNVLFRSTNQGQSWERISPDLTRNDKSRESEGRLEDIYCTIFSIAPSPQDKNVIWTGSDDGLIHLTRDAGKTWTNVTPPELKPWTRINIIEASPQEPATAYVAANRYQLDDFRSYIYRTHDYGKTWRLVTAGIPENTFVRTIREDPVRKNLLYAGTETGVYVSFDGGGHWQSLQLNLPVVPITDLKVKDGDLVASTQGRSFWILDDITPLEHMTAQVEAAKVHLFPPRPAYRMRHARFFGGREGLGHNPPSGLVVHYYLAGAPSEPVSLEFQDGSGKTIKTFTISSKPAEYGPRPGAPGEAVTTHEGLNSFVWDLRYPDAHGIAGRTYLFGGSLRGPEAVPGKYKVILTVDGQSYAQPFEIRKDPRVPTTQEGFQRQFDLLLAVRDKLSAAHDAINVILGIQKQMGRDQQKAHGNSAVEESSRKLSETLDSVLHKLVELRFTGFDDQTLVYPLQLNNRIAAMQAYVQGEFAPTDQDYKVFNELSAELTQQLAELKHVVDTRIPEFNAALKAEGIAPIQVPETAGITKRE